MKINNNNNNNKKKKNNNNKWRKARNKPHLNTAVKNKRI